MKTNELIAVNLSCFWRVDRGYDTFPIRALDWYNVSFDIAMEEGGSDWNIATLVRDNGFRFSSSTYSILPLLSKILLVDWG